jgi:hypothetical protein
VALEKEWWGGKDSFFESSIGFNPVGLFFTEPDVKCKTSRPDTEEKVQKVGKKSICPLENF